MHSNETEARLSDADRLRNMAKDLRSNEMHGYAAECERIAKKMEQLSKMLAQMKTRQMVDSTAIRIGWSNF